MNGLELGLVWVSIQFKWDILIRTHEMKFEIEINFQQNE